MISVAKTLAVHFSFIMVASCALIDSRLDDMGDDLNETFRDYCAMPVYRREALSILINGSLETSHIRVDITCPGESLPAATLPSQ